MRSPDRLQMRFQVDDERDLNSAETFQEKISKGIRWVSVGGHEKAAEEPEDVEEERSRMARKKTSDQRLLKRPEDSADQESGEEETRGS